MYDKPDGKPSMRVPIELSAGACGDELVGWIEGRLKVRVAAPEHDGRADEALESLLAEVIGRPGTVRVVTGHRSRRKIVEIARFDEHDLEWHLPGRDHPAVITDAVPLFGLEKRPAAFEE